MKPSDQATIEAILIRIRRQSDFPAMAQTVSAISKFRASDEGSSTELANVILRDYSLTSKILKLVNSVGYLQYGEVTTVSRAIMLLGMENIRNLAITLLLFDQVGSKSGNLIKDCLLRAVHSGATAQLIANEIKLDAEEAFICALFHTFGRIMVNFYLPEKAAEIVSLMERQGYAEDTAAGSVLGTSYEAIGAAVAESWNFPKRIVYSMKTLRPTELNDNPTEMERLCSISNFSNEITRIIAESRDAGERDRQLSRLQGDYRNHYGSVEEKLGGMIEQAAGSVLEYADLFKLPAGSIPFISRMVKSDESPAAASPPSSDQSAGVSSIADILRTEAPDVPESVFSKGILEINTAILNNDPLNDIIRIALETMYRGLQKTGVRHVLFFLRDSRQPLMHLKFGFGADIAGLRSWFDIPLDAGKDIFSASITRNSDAVVRDLGTSEIRTLLPEWYKSRVSLSTFLIMLPIVINARPFGLFYVEGERDNFGALAREDLKHLTILRDQTVLAIRQKHAT